MQLDCKTWRGFIQNKSLVFCAYYPFKFLRDLASMIGTCITSSVTAMGKPTYWYKDLLASSIEGERVKEVFIPFQGIYQGCRWMTLIPWDISLVPQFGPFFLMLLLVTKQWVSTVPILWFELNLHSTKGRRKALLHNSARFVCH